MKAFAETMKAELEERFPENRFEIVEVTKSNDRHLTGIAVRDDSRIGAAFYLNDAYDAYKNGGSFQYLVDELEEAIRNVVIPTVDVDLSWEAVKDRLMPKVLGAERNRDYLKTVVTYNLFNGLVIVPEIIIGDNMRLVVTKVMAEANGYDEYEVIKQSMANPCIEPIMTDLTDAVIGIGENLLERDHVNYGLYAITTYGKANGAGALFCDGVMARIEEVFGSEYFIIPSSVHEFLVIPDQGSLDAADLADMVRFVNAEVVDEDEILCDGVFKWHNGQILRVA